MATDWPQMDYAEWADGCDTLHAHTQVLGKLAAVLAPEEPQFQHGALRLSARGWETLPLPAPNGSGRIVVALDLRTHHAVIEHSGGDTTEIALGPDRAVASVTGDVLSAIGAIAGRVEIDPIPSEVPWDVPLTEDTQHATYDPAQVATYFEMATLAAEALVAFRAPFLGRSTPLNAWWGSFDLASSLFSDDVAGTEVAVGWWPGDPTQPKAAFYAYAVPGPDGLRAAEVEPQGAGWSDDLAQFLLPWHALSTSVEPIADALAFARSFTFAAATALGWDEKLTRSATRP